MARAKSRFTQAEVAKLIKAAKGTGFDCVSIEVLPGAAGLRAVYTISQGPRDEPSALETWKAKRAREQIGERAFVNAAGRNAAPSPEFMSEAEYAVAIRASALSSRERKALEALYHCQGRDVPHNEIKGAGISTQQSLQARGFATITMDGDRFISWRITIDGVRFWRELAALPPHL